MSRIKFKKVVTYIVGIRLEPGHYRVVLDGWHVFDDGAGLTSKVGTMPVCLFGAAESNKFLVDDLKVAQVT